MLGLSPDMANVIQEEPSDVLNLSTLDMSLALHHSSSLEAVVKTKTKPQLPMLVPKMTDINRRHSQRC